MKEPSWRRVWHLGVVVWAALNVIGMGVLIRYSLTPGPSGVPPDVLPAAYVAGGGSPAFTLLMAVHPHCPCTQAALTELEAIMSRGSGRVKAYVFFVQPGGTSEAWATTSLWRRSQRMAGVHPVLDPGGREANALGALTSSSVALYDPTGHLVFHGGITGARGMVGPNSGEQAIVSVLSGHPGTVGRAPVYGCPLQTPASGRRQESARCQRM